ncbi:MAG: NYN domain-containing protein [Bacteroidales bacterium]|nr:NYN domain-containing protein [Bacteroidales bacterium]
MSKKRVVIFIDGQNLYHALRSMDLKEININFAKLFNDCLEENDELIRTYLFRPEKVQNFYVEKRRIAIDIISKMEDFSGKNDMLEKLRKYTDISFLEPDILIEIESEYTNCNTWLKDLKQQFSQSDFKYAKMSENYSDFSIERKGVLKVDPYNQKIIGEKGVDVALSVNMVKMSLSNKLDKIILFSGDFDLSEGIQICKDNLHKVHIVKIHRGHPPKNISSSRHLLCLADKVINVYESDLKGKYRNRR